MKRNRMTIKCAMALLMVSIVMILTGQNVFSQQRPDEQRQKPPRDKGNREQRNGQQHYSLEQAMSDQAQLHTIAFSGLAFITGDFGADTFIPPGKVCDFFGFQYMRDIDVAQKGHNPMFLDRVAGNVLYILTDAQRKIFANAASEEAIKMKNIAVKRFPLIKAFYRQLKGDIPGSSTGLNKKVVMNYVGEIFKLDAEMSYHRAQIFGQVAMSLSQEQKAYLSKMKFGDFSSWPAVDMDQFKLPRGTDKMINVAYMTYASEFFSWYAGSVDADTYFCPERHGTYFGGFYMKDMPAMGKKNYDISTSVTGDSGKGFIDTLTDSQRSYIMSVPEQQREALREIASVRRMISMELRKFLTGKQADKSKVIALGKRYGELDGEVSYYYTVAFSQINKTLSSQQRSTLMRLRNLDGYTSAPAYMYSSPMQSLPEIPDTDSFFFEP